jgi:translation initiation factor 1A
MMILHIKRIMPKNTIGGKGHKRSKNEPSIRHTVIFREDGQQYAQALKMLGSGRIKLACVDGQERIGIIRGKMYKKSWIAVGDTVLVSNRDFQDNKADIIHRYIPDDVRILKQAGELPANYTGRESNDDDDNVGFEFTNVVNDRDNVKTIVESDSDSDGIDIDDI